MRQTVHFCNEGQLDLTAATTMGVSVKETDSLIGYFGTGFKYSVATLLRTGHTVSVRVGDDLHHFTAEAQTIRGQEFELVHLDGVPTGFTTALGRNWEMWQAYRELACNAMDEPSHTITDDTPSQLWDTVISVTGDPIHEAFQRRDEIFCSSPVLSRMDGVVEIREGESSHIFYRGVRAGTLPAPSRLTYNVLETSTLTEDRTLAFMHILPMVVGRGIAHSDSDRVMHALFRAPGSLEKNAQFSTVSAPSDCFMEHAARERSNARVNSSAISLWRRSVPDQDLFSPVELSESEMVTVGEALEMCIRVDGDFLLPMDRLSFVRTCGPDILGLYSAGMIYIPRSTVDQGPRRLASTLYEEYLHMEHSLDDESRSLQNFLLDKLFSHA